MNKKNNNKSQQNPSSTDYYQYYSNLVGKTIQNYVDTQFWSLFLVTFSVRLIVFLDRCLFFFSLIAAGFDITKVIPPDLFYHWKKHKSDPVSVPIFENEYNDNENDNENDNDNDNDNDKNEQKIDYSKETPIFRNVSFTKKLFISDKNKTLGSIFQEKVKKFPNKKCFGVRKLKSIKYVKKPGSSSSKTWKQFNFDSNEITWNTYKEADQRIDDISTGIKLFTNLNSTEKFAIYENTCLEWMMIAQSLFRRNIILVTVYATLGIKAIQEALFNTETTAIFTNEQFLSNLLSIIPNLPKLKYLILNPLTFNSNITTKTISDLEQKYKIKIITVSNLEKLGKDNRDLTFKGNKSPKNSNLKKTIPEYEIKPTGNSIVMIMHTSGTTTKPKGVVIKHQSFVSGIEGDAIAMNLQLHELHHVSYLPLAHSLEMITCNFVFYHGGKILFSSPLTLGDSSAKPYGDIACLQPTVFTCVPRVLETMKKAVLNNVNSIKTSTFQKWMFETAYHYKLKNLNEGYPSPLWDLLVFNKISKKCTGGKMVFLLCGGAPLHSSTAEFIRIVTNVAIIHGYGLTETCSSLAIQAHTHPFSSNLGAIVPTAEVKLVSIPELGYFANSRIPQGEICVRSICNANGYYKDEKKTKEAWDKDGFFHTGDIGEIDVDNRNTFKVIDRVKNLLKLAQGEYIPIESVESVYMVSPFLSPNGICIYGDSFKTYLTAILLVDVQYLKTWAQKNGLIKKDNEKINIDLLLNHPKVLKAVQDNFNEIEKSNNLSNIEKIKKFTLVNGIWSSENGLLTASMKLNRRAIYEYYKKEINYMYQN